MTDSLSPEQVEFSWLLHLLRWEAVQTVTSPPQVGSSADCHLFQRMKELSSTCPHAWDFRVGAGGGGTRGRDTFSSFIVWVQGVCQRLILSSSPLKPDSMVRLWKIIAKISPKRRTEHDSFKFNVSQATVEEGEQCVEVLHGLLFISPIKHRWPAKSVWTLRSALLIHLEEAKHPHRVRTPELGRKQNPE